MELYENAIISPFGPEVVPGQTSHWHFPRPFALRTLREVWRSEASLEADITGFPFSGKTYFLTNEVLPAIREDNGSLLYINAGEGDQNLITTLLERILCAVLGLINTPRSFMSIVHGYVLLPPGKADADCYRLLYNGRVAAAGPAEEIARHLLPDLRRQAAGPLLVAIDNAHPVTSENSAQAQLKRFLNNIGLIHGSNAATVLYLYRDPTTRIAATNKIGESCVTIPWEYDLGEFVDTMMLSFHQRAPQFHLDRRTLIDVQSKFDPALNILPRILQHMLLTGESLHTSVKTVTARAVAHIRVAIFAGLTPIELKVFHGVMRGMRMYSKPAMAELAHFMNRTSDGVQRPLIQYSLSRLAHRGLVYRNPEGSWEPTYFARWLRIPNPSTSMESKHWLN